MTNIKAKVHKIRFRLGLRHRPCWGSLQRSPRPPTWIWGPDRGTGGGLGWGRGGKGGGRGGPQVTVEPGPLRALLRHCSCSGHWFLFLTAKKMFICCCEERFMIGMYGMVVNVVIEQRKRIGIALGRSEHD